MRRNFGEALFCELLRPRLLAGARKWPAQGAKYPAESSSGEALFRTACFPSIERRQESVGAGSGEEFTRGQNAKLARVPELLSLGNVSYDVTCV